MYILIMGGLMLAALSGCQKDLVTPNGFTPISRMEAEKLISDWNTQRKSTLKSAATITLTEKQWQKAKVSLNTSDHTSIIALPLAPRLKLCFLKNDQKTVMYFTETRPDSLYLAQNGGKVFLNNYTGLLIFYNDKGKGVVAHQYENGEYKCDYEVEPKHSHLKDDIDITKEMFYTETVVCTYIRPSASGFSSSSIFGGSPRRITEEKVCIQEDGSDDPSPDPNEPKIEDDSLKKNPCAQFAWDMLNSTSTSFRSLIEPFLGQKSTLNITFDVKNFPTDAILGQAYPIKGNVIININGNVASSASSLLTASVFCHEIIHAEICRILQENHYDMTACKDDYAALWRNWEKYRNAEVFNPNEMTQHGTMADAYTDLIVKMLMEFDRNQGITNRDPMIYEALAWGGLQDTDEWKELPPMCQEKYISLLALQKSAGGCGK
jgi:hypothetical protein